MFRDFLWKSNPSLYVLICEYPLGFMVLLRERTKILLEYAMFSYIILRHYETPFNMDKQWYWHLLSVLSLEKGLGIPILLQIQHINTWFELSFILYYSQLGEWYINLNSFKLDCGFQIKCCEHGNFCAKLIFMHQDACTNLPTQESNVHNIVYCYHNLLCPKATTHIYVMRSGKTCRMSQKDILRNGLK